MAAPARNKLFKRTLGSLGHAFNADPMERMSGIRHAAESWSKNVRENHVTVEEFLKWAETEAIFIDAQKKINTEAIKERFTTSAEIMAGYFSSFAEAYLAETPESGVDAEADLKNRQNVINDFKAYLEAIADHFKTVDHDAIAAAKRRHYLDISILRKQAHKFRSQNQPSTGEVLEEEVQSIIHRHKLEAVEIDAFYLEREKVILSLYRKIDILSALPDSSPRKAEVKAEIETAALQYDLMTNGDFSEEFTQGYEDLYILDREKYLDEIRSLEEQFAATHNEPPPSTSSQGTTDATGNAAQDPQPDAPQTGKPVAPSEVSIYAIRDHKGDVLQHTGALDYGSAVRQFLATSKGAVSLSVDFAIDGLTVDKKRNVTVTQYGSALNWQVTAKEITWRTAEPNTAPLQNSSFSALEADMQLGPSDGFSLKTEADTTVTMLYPTTRASITAKENAVLVVGDRFSDSSFSAKSAFIDFQGASAIASGSRFSGQISTLNPSKPVDRIQEHTLQRSENIFHVTENILMAGLEIGPNVRGAHAQYNPHLLSASGPDLLIIDYFMTAIAAGYEARHIDFTENADAYKKKLASLRAIIKAGKGPLNLIVHPLMTSPDDFNSEKLRDVNKRNYRLTFYTDEVAPKKIGVNLATPLDPSSPTGYPLSYFDMLNNFLAPDQRQVLSLDICVHPPGEDIHYSRRATVANVKDLGTIYASLSKAGVDDTILKFSYLSCTTEIPKAKAEGKAKAKAEDTAGSEKYHRAFDGEHYAIRREKLSACLASLQPFVPTHAPLVLNGRHFENCTFSGLYNDAVIESPVGSFFEQTRAHGLALFGDWDRTRFSDCWISAGSIGPTSFRYSHFQASEFELVGDGVSECLADGMICQDTVLNIQNYRRFSSKNSSFKGQALTLRGMGYVDLSGSRFEDCTMDFRDIEKLNISGAQFINCTLSHNDKSIELSPVIIITPGFGDSNEIEALKMTDLIKEAHFLAYHGRSDQYARLEALVDTHSANEINLRAILMGISQAHTRLKSSNIQSAADEAQSLERTLNKIFSHKDFEKFKYALYRVVYSRAIPESEKRLAAGQTGLKGDVKIQNADIRNSTITFNCDRLDLNNTAITEKSAVRGQVGSVDISEARLGSDIQSSDTTKWRLQSGSVELAKLSIGNLAVETTGFFGTQTKRAWSSIQVTGAPTFVPDKGHEAFLTHLGMAANSISAHPSFAKDDKAGSVSFRLKPACG